MYNYYYISHNCVWSLTLLPLFCIFCRQLAEIIFFGLIHYSLLFVSPQVLRLLINHMDSDEESWKGYLYTLALFANSLVSAVTFHFFSQLISVASLQMRSSLISMVYRKSLRLSNQARRLFTVGEITNLMSIDAQRMVETFPYSNHMWIGPFNFLLAMIFLYMELGPSSLAGLTALLIITPVNTWAGRIGLRLQKDQLKKKDARLKLMNELLAGIKVLKLYAWE